MGMGQSRPLSSLSPPRVRLPARSRPRPALVRRRPATVGGGDSARARAHVLGRGRAYPLGADPVRARRDDDAVHGGGRKRASTHDQRRPCPAPTCAGSQTDRVVGAFGSAPGARFEEGPRSYRPDAPAPGACVSTRVTTDHQQCPPHTRTAHASLPWQTHTPALRARVHAGTSTVRALATRFRHCTQARAVPGSRTAARRASLSL